MSASDEGGMLRLPRQRRYTLYFIAVGVFLTGVLWLYFHYFLRTEGPFGMSNHPLEVVWLKAHGAFSILAVWIFGVLWGVHVVRGWNMHWRRWSGGAMVSAVVILTLTGWGLYYLEDREVTEWTSIVHWVTGLASFALFFLHWLSKSLPRKDG